MRAVWSFWSKPFILETHVGSPLFRGTLAAWILSVESARQHYAQTVLYTDHIGFNLLVKQLGIEFDWVETSLESLTAFDPAWWATGKLLTYSLQQEPFIHLDGDVILWKALPADLLKANLYAQNPEPFIPGCCESYWPEHLEEKLPNGGRHIFPQEWFWFRRQRPLSYGVNCGFLGGLDMAFIRSYAKNALQIINHPGLKTSPMGYHEKRRHMVLIEQYLLAALISYRSRELGDDRFHFACLFSSEEDARLRARQLGYTHLIGRAKINPRLIERLELRIAHDYPRIYRNYVRINEGGKW